MREIDGYIKKLRKTIGNEAELGFKSTFVFGILVHLIVFTNHLPTYSGLFGFEGYALPHALEGRWVSAFLKSTIGVVTIPFFLGMISLFFWSLSFAVIVKIFKIKSSTAVVLMSAIYISFPTVAAMNQFMFMSYCFAAGTLLSCLGVYMFLRGQKVTDMVGILCLVFAIASYQAVLSVAMVLIFTLVAFDILDGKIKIKEIWLRIGRYSLLLIISLAIYYIVFKSYLHIGGLESYRDFSITAESFFRGVIKCYGGAYWFLGWGSVFSHSIGQIIVILTVALIVIMVGGLLVNKLCEYNNKAIRVLMLLGLVILCPIVANYAYLVSPDESRTYRQFGAYVIIFCMPILLCERYEGDFKGIQLKLNIIFFRVLQSFAVMLALVSSLFFGVVDNIAYMNSHIQYEKEYSLALRVVDRIENTEGYEQGMPVIMMFREGYFEGLYNGGIEAQLDKYIPGMEQCGWGYLSTSTGFQYFINEFIQTDINFTWEPIDDDMYREMNKWPENGCTLIKDGKLYLWLT